MNPVAYLEGQNIKLGPSFNKWRIENNYKTLRAFMDDEKRYRVVPGADFKCGWTDSNGKAQPIPKNGDMRVSGYTHDGPCEVWLDDKMVAQGDNCHNDFPAKKTLYRLFVVQGLTFFRYIYEKNVGVPLSGEDTNEIVDVDVDSGVCLRECFLMSGSNDV
ncbi:unnamed protein product [Peronospora farinosa]|uniref:Uncharacterized protein n=1 Tax=Peronospora farinosa TaxID=134698 RepID=A0AAV0UM65_9STRA|nr:unnamed protein product [Peronospora farinosa]